MAGARYLVAKYVPNLQRMEPRNVGVIVWSPHGLSARFAAERVDAPGEIDGRKARSYVNSLNTYRQWVQFWRAELQNEAIEPISGGKAVHKESRDFLDVLKESSKGSYSLADGGLLLDSVDSDELPDVTDQLFYELVSSVSEEESHTPSVKEICGDLIRSTNLERSPYFLSDYIVRYDGGRRSHEFHYALANGKPEYLYRRVGLPGNRIKEFSKNAHDSAWIFEKVVQEAKVVPSDNSAALVYISEEQLAQPEVKEPLEDLRSVTRVLNLSKSEDFEKTRAEFAGLAQIRTHGLP